MTCGRARADADAEPAATDGESGDVDDVPPETAPASSPVAPPVAPPAAPPVSPPVAPPPPAYAPPPAAPSPFGAFLGRAMSGDWAGSVKAALWPLVLLLASATALAIPSYDQGDEVVVGFAARLRIALALLLQGVGGGFEVAGADRGHDSAFGELGSELTAGGSLSVLPLTVTALFAGALFIGVRVLRGRLPEPPAGGAGAARTAGLEAAVRVVAVVTGGVLVLGLVARPKVEGVAVTSSPELAALGAAALAALVAVGALHRGGPGVAERPRVQAVFTATGTAVRALLVAVALCALVGLVTLAQAGDMDQDGLLICLFLLPNIGVMVLGLGWGAGVEATADGRSDFGGGYESETFDLGALGDQFSSWAVVGALALGLVCALLMGALTARRARGRGEQLLAAGVYFGLFLLLCAVSGLDLEASGSAAGLGGDGNLSVGTSVPDALLFGLLWIAAATFIGPYLLQMTGRTAGVVPPVPGGAPPAPGAAPPVPGEPAAPALPAGPAGPAGPSVLAVPAEPAQPAEPQGLFTADPYDPHTFHLGTAPGGPAVPAGAAESPRSKAFVWTVTLVAAFVIGGGATAGVLLLTDGDGDGGGSADAAPAATDRPAESPAPSAGDDADPAEESPAAPEASPEEAATAPDGFRIRTGPEGFSFAVPDEWSRTGEENGQITYAGSTGYGHFLIGVVPDAEVSSIDNFRTLEEGARKKPGYQRIRLEENTFQGRPGALWEYTFTDEQSGRTVHAIDQGYVAQDGTEYAVYLTDWDADWADGPERTFQVALDTWRLDE